MCSNFVDFRQFLSIYLPSVVIKWVCYPIYTHINPWEKLNLPYAITRLTAHFMCGLMSDLVICNFRKSMIIHDTECPCWDQVSLNNTKLNESCLFTNNWIYTDQWRGILMKKCICAAFGWVTCESTDTDRTDRQPSDSMLPLSTQQLWVPGEMKSLWVLIGITAEKYWILLCWDYSQKCRMQQKNMYFLLPKWNIAPEAKTIH